ncbi:flagellar hook-length control protein FliK [Clostridium cibarium]|uniref:Flagellar hook-length control protein FliK n=1 Tax=Clostridium cibarium TaxID=2762247 RepID=A0ABR8PNV7_9CLOT|nr:flagellar hook-length control protein FliK [Clostridium cibarium]MBD7909840.1 flagellar hook-length control protein FliK [Clostridium cibarium]
MKTSLNFSVEIQKVNDIVTQSNSVQEKSKNTTAETGNKFSDYLQDKKEVNASVAKEAKCVAKDDKKAATDNELEDAKELDEKVKTLSKDDILQCLAALVETLNQAKSANEGNLSLQEKVDMVDKLNSSINESLMKALELKNNLDNNGSTNSTSKEVDPASLINNLLQLLDMNNADELLNKKSLTTAQSLLNQLGVAIDKDANFSGNKIEDKNFLQDLLNKLKEEVSSLLEKANKDEVSNNGDITKIIIPKENNKVNNAEGTNKALEKVETVVKENPSYEKSSNNSGNESKNDSNLSKDDKILKSILGEDSKGTPKVPFFATSTVQSGNVAAIKEVQVVNRATMAEDVIKSVKFMTSNNLKEMIVKVNPGNLGEITIRLVEEDGNMKLNIKASAKETYNLLSQQASEVKNHLSNQNIKIQEVNIGVYDDDTTFFKDGQFQNNFSEGEHKKGNSNAKTSKESYTEEEPAESELNELSNINMLA